MVHCLESDEHGFLWIGTSYGLNRFDGYSFKTFFPDEADSASLRGSTIFDVKNGLDGILWLLTNEGVEYLDKKTELFHSISIPTTKEQSYCTNLCLDSDGALWTYCTQGNFVRFCCTKKSVIQESIALPDSVLDKTSVHIFRFSIQGKTLWIATSAGIFAYNYQTKICTRITQQKKYNYCHRIRHLQNGILAFVFFHEGVCMVNTVTNEIEWVRERNAYADVASKILYTDVVQLKDNSIAIGSTSGLLLREKGENFCSIISAISSGFSGTEVSTLHQDKTGNIWIGTRENGMYLSNDRSMHVNMVNRIADGQRLVANSVESFANGSVLIAANDRCYYADSHADLFTGNISVFKEGFSSELFHKDRTCCIVRSSDSLFEYNSETRICRFLANSHSAQNACMDSNSVLWIGSWNGQITGINTVFGNKSTIDLKNSNGAAMGISAMRCDWDNSLWIGTFNSGVVHIQNPSSDARSVTLFQHRKGDANSLGGNNVTSLFNANDSIIWVGTRGGGLNRLHKRNKTISTITIENGLTSNAIESVLGDDHGYIWIASNTITKYAPLTNIATHYSVADGIFDSYFTNSCALSAEGTLLFGSNSGLLEIDSYTKPNYAQIEKPSITGFRIAGSTVSTGDTLDGYVPCNKAIAYTDTLELPYVFNSVSFEFASAQFQNQHNILYQYMLEGADRTWLPPGKSRIASYSMLRPGSYHFRVRSSLNAIDWSDERVLVLTITPPWWKTWWFRLLLSLSIVAGFALIIVFRLKSMQKVNRVLEKKINARTAELKKANTVLNHTNKQMAEQQLVLEMKNSQLKEALNSKQELISILGHDFKNPLSGIISVSELIKKEAGQSQHPKLTEYAEMNLNNAMRLMNQMVTVIEWSRSQDNDIIASPAEINIEFLLNDAIALVKDIAQRKNIKLSVQAEYKTNAYVDPNMASTVFRNLLSNAIKFTPRGGAVMVMVQEIDECLDITFIDTGLGIPDEKKQYIFNGADIHATTYGTENEKGSGLGLSICKSFVEKNNGTIRLDSTVGEGSVFTVSIPKGTKSATKIARLPEIGSSCSAEKPSVLIIDDNTGIVRTVQETFGDTYIVHKAFEGREGLYLAKNIVPDIIICDVNLPGAGGLQICRELKNNDLTSHIPILLITSQSDTSIEQQGYACGANDFIHKPLNMGGLKRKIAALLEYKNKIAELAVKEQQSGTEQLPLNYENKMVKKVIDFLHSNISDPSITTETLVDYMGVSRTQLWRILKSTTGKTASEFIRDIRLEKSTALLKTGKYRISEIAFEVGYADPKYFTKCFTKHFGMNPSAYQEKMSAPKQ